MKKKRYNLFYMSTQTRNPKEITRNTLSPQVFNRKYLLQLTIPHVMATLFWCKVFKAPDLPSKHHIIGYEPLIDSRPIRNGRPVQEKNSLSPVHHMVLYECAEDHDKRQWNEWAESDNDGFFGPSRPGELATCVTPIAAWAMGSKGKF